MPIRIDKLSGFAAGSASLPLGRDSKKGGRLGQGEEAMAVEPNEIACDAEVRSCQHTHVLNQAHDTRQPQGPVLHGLFDPSYFHDFQRRLREEVATSQQLKAATNDSEASSGNDRQAPRVFSKDESQKTESEGEGEDIEEAEFKIADETSDEETSQDRAMIDDAPQEEENEVVRCCRMNAAMETDSEAEGFSQVLARLKRRAPGGATSPLQSRRRRRVLLSSSDSSGEEEDSPSQGRSQAVSVEHPPVPKEGGALGTDCQMLDDLSPELEDDGWSDDLPPEPEDDGWSDLFDLSLEDDFAKSCVIVPRLRWASRQTTAANGAPTALDAAGQASLEPPTSLSAPIPSAAAAQSAIRAAQQEQNTPAAAQGLGRAPNSVPAPARSATPAAPEPDVAAPRYPPPSSTSQPPPSPPIVSKGSAVQETVPPRQVPSPTNMGGPSRVDPILAAAHHFHTMGVASLTFNMKVWLNDKGEEKKAPAGLMREWQNKCDLGNCLREGVRPGRGCVAIVTEPSDIYALDVDTKDGGVEAFERMLEEHGPLPDDTPWEWSGNRPGRHFFFSLSQSKAAGLLSGAGRTRLTYKGVKVGLDMRGEGGMLFVGPTSYKGSDGAVRQYEWVQEIAPDRSNLRALPPWLIVIINASDVPQAAPRSQDPVSFFVARSMDEPDSEEIELPPQPVVLERIKKSLAGLGDSCSRFDKLKRSPAGDMYVFRVSGAHVCPYGVNHSGSNNFCVLVRGGNLLCKCNSPECCDMHPLRKIGELSAQESMMGGETAPVAEDDTTVYKELTKPFVDYWVFRGDMGGSRIVAQMYSRCHRIWNDGKTWWMWDGKRFKQATVERVKFVCIHQLSTVYSRLRAELKEPLSVTTDEEEKKELKRALDKVRRYYDAGEISSTLTIMTGEMALDLVGELDSNPDILNVQNGVINLRTGELDIHRPEYLCTKLADINYKGLGHPTPIVKGFLDDIFNEDRALIDFMQRLWGYAINGRTSEEIIVFLLGSGGNGKGVCKQMLETALGEYYGVMSKDAVVKAPGQHPPSKGAATGYLAELQGKRVAVTDETSPGERVDLGNVLMMTGGGKVSSRLLYQNNVSFRFTHTPFIQTNYDPEIPPTLAKQPNIDRRLIVVRFPNEYVTENKFDETNPNHRHVDIGLKDRMESQAVREEFLTFLVQGSRAWYEDPTVLRTHPPAVQAASMAWLGRGDKLQIFLQSEHCVHDLPETPDNAKTVTWEDEFWTQFQRFTGVKIAKEELARQMREKGLARTKRAGRYDGSSQRSSCYVGFKCEYD